LAFALFVCALASSAAATVTFPVALMVILWWKRDVITGKELLGILPFFIAAAAAGAWTAWLQVTSLASRVLTVAFGYTSTADSMSIAARSIWFYAMKLIAPYPLMFDYPRWAGAMAMGVIYGLLIVALLIVLWVLRDRIGRAPRAAVLLFLLAIAPMLNLLDPPATRYSFVADYRQYLASAALIVLIASLATQAIMSEKLRDKVNPSYCAGAVIVVLAALSFHQGTFYLTNQTLWNHTVLDNKASVLGAEGYADTMLGGGQFYVAQRWYDKAQSLAPRDPRAAVGLGTVAAALGYEDQAAGHPELTASQQTSAQQYFQDAIGLDPDYKPAYIALAELYKLRHNDLAAIDALKEAVRIEPESLRPRLELGGAQRRAGLLDDAEKTLTDLADDAPNISAVHTELGNVYIQKHNLQGALGEWQKAIQLDPTNTTVLLNFGELLDSSGEPDLAAKQFLAATMIDPSLVLAHAYLAHVYTKLGHRHDAVLELTKAVELDPTNTRAVDRLAKAQDEEKRLGAGTPANSQPSLSPTSDASSQPSGGGDILSPATNPATEPTLP
jgi:Tfp pilus assembly protein PilF